MTEVTYICAKCGNLYSSNRSDEEAMQEAVATFGPDEDMNDSVVICTDCYSEFMEWFQKQKH